MKTTKLFSYFNAALGWNAAFYSFYKITSTCLTFFLFKTLCAQWFSCWATGNSLTFLFLLWIDFGFKKSIPRFYPIYLGLNYHRQFITKILLLRIITILAALPLVLFIMTRWWWYPSLVQWIMLLFSLQGLSTVFELLYHAHFWQRDFAIMHTASLLIEITCNFWLLSSHTLPQEEIVKWLFINKAMGSVILIVISASLLPILHKRRDAIMHKDTEQTHHELKTSFIKYSLFMWFSTFIKSLSERNFLVPFFTFTMGAPIANTYKVANDAALIFQRTVLRTIGIADMSLLSYACLEKSTAQLLQAFGYLVRTLVLITFPLATVTILVTRKFNKLATNELAIMFGIIIGGYLIEMVLSAYERLLEVEFKFSQLFKAYLPYIILYGCLLILTLKGYVGLIIYLGITQTARIISSLIMALYGYHLYKEPLPKAFICKVAALCLGVIALAWYAI